MPSHRDNTPYVFEADERNFADGVLQRSREVPVLVDFWAGWCAPCQALMPVLERLSDEYQGKFILAKVNSDDQQGLAQQHGIRSLPTVLVFRHGEIVDRFVGAQPEAAIRRLIEQYIERPSDRLRAEARECLERGDITRALDLLESAHRSDPGNSQVTLDLAELALRRDDPATAMELLDSLPVDEQQSQGARALSARARFTRELQGAPDAATLERRIGADPADLAARYQLALYQILNRDHIGGLEGLLEIVRRDRAFKDDGARKALLAAFDLLGGQQELVNRFRRNLATLLH